MRTLSVILPAAALALALLAGASSAWSDERDRGVAHLGNQGDIFLVYMPQIETCMIIYDGFKAGGATEVDCTYDFRALAKTVRVPEPSE
ncbi:hypothetical protein CKO28_02780 [Rhodovibrio sodomensis]|uniref:Uncharacterized protein n=1 Tax=Rhodovibrio sodomensis TaxID=1088 RepID=A0ABS1DB85_9PROT|nr:hypothetical protein [Rhodovibrio sodomensis]MBK1666968.1 hypothetical protein [Rhodovibrio sodomensis]